jgi:hypothetical protein
LPVIPAEAGITVKKPVDTGSLPPGPVGVFRENRIVRLGNPVMFSISAILSCFSGIDLKESSTTAQFGIKSILLSSRGKGRKGVEV